MLFQLATLAILALGTTALPQTSNAVYFRPSPEHYVFELEPLQDQRVSATFEQQKEVALKFVMEKLQIASANDIQSSDSFADNAGVAFFHFTPLFNGFPVANAEANVNVDRYGRVSSMGSSWTSPQLSLRDDQSTTTASDALIAFATMAGLEVDSASLIEQEEGTSIVINGATFANGLVTADLKYYRTETTLEKVYELIVPTADHYYNVFVSLASGKVVAVNDWTVQDHFEASNESSASRLAARSETETPETPAAVGEFTYRVVPFPNSDNSYGQGVVVNPADLVASPLGWHDSGKGNQNTTVGNNVQVQNTKNFTNRRPTSATYTFDFKADDATQKPEEYWEMSATNLFYVNNFVHDVTYEYGFDEVSGNFQTTNFKKGGGENDQVLANGQDRGGTNNANFATPPDGRSGVMNMYLFNQGTVNGRDGSLDNVVVAHEYMHGVSNRLTGGPSNSNCLRMGQSGGMGEGWSDMLALVLTTTSKSTRSDDRPIGRYVLPKLPGGIRQAPYSTNLTTNKLMYSSLKTDSEVHAAGTVWATLLNEVYWNLIDKLGFVENVRDNARSGKGNTVFLGNMIDGLKLQPCSPSFINARDAIIEADRLKNNGDNYCEIWKGFAKRGLGFGAKSVLIDDFTLPSKCA